MTDNDESICENDARGMVRLLGETAALEGGHAEKKRYLMNGIAELIGAEAWVWGLCCDVTPGVQQSYVNLIHSGFDDLRLARFFTAFSHPRMGAPVEQFYQALADEGEVTMKRSEIDPNDMVGQDEELAGLWADADIGPVIMSGFRLDETSASCLALYRRVGEVPFTARELALSHIVLSEVQWLHQSGWPEDRGATVPTLFPRQRTVLNLLLDGLSRKQIAHCLEISENTVSGYAKDIYRHFSVNSQPELMQKFMRRYVRSA
ncbi:MAG: helix-turn-helix transcriptional regulator [Puniceicoccales bacterium]